MALPSKVGQYIGKEMWGHEYEVYPFIAYAEQRIVDAILDTEHERYVIVNAPPQTGKTSLLGILLPFWLTGMFPHWQVMYISYSDDFSTSKGKDVRTLHELFGNELFGSRIDPNFTQGADWRVVGGRGGMLSIGVGGLITGRPGHVILIDDLLKNAEEASSQATKKKHLAEWDGTIHTRLQPGGTVIVIATRWAEDDLSGALIERQKEPGYTGPQWEVIEFPAFAEPPDGHGELTDDELEQWSDIIGRKNGEVLDCRFSRIPGRDPEDFFTLKRSSMADSFAWSCLYQQKPSSREGGMFPVENWQFYDELPEMDKQVRIWDLAATEGGGDWTVGTLMGRSGDKFYVMDVQRFRKSAGGVQDEVMRVAKMDGYSIKIKFEEEKGGSGKSVTEAYKRLLIGHTVEPSKAEGDKESRSSPYSAEQNKKRVFLPRPGAVAWDVKGFIEEHRKMMGDGRRPKHDDQIDTAAYCILELLGGGNTEIWIPSAGSNWMSAEQQMNVLMDRGLSIR